MFSDDTLVKYVDQITLSPQFWQTLQNNAADVVSGVRFHQPTYVHYMC